MPLASNYLLPVSESQVPRITQAVLRVWLLPQRDRFEAALHLVQFKPAPWLPAALRTRSISPSAGGWAPYKVTPTCKFLLLLLSCPPHPPSVLALATPSVTSQLLLQVCSAGFSVPFRSAQTSRGASVNHLCTSLLWNVTPCVSFPASVTVATPWSLLPCYRSAPPTGTRGP